MATSLAPIRFWLSPSPDRIRIEWSTAIENGCALGTYTPGTCDFIRWESTGAVMDEVPSDVEDIAKQAFRSVYDSSGPRMPRMPRGYEGDETVAQMNAAWCAIGDALEAA